MIEEAIKKPAIYWYLLPNHKQGRRVIFQGKLIDGRDFLDCIPSELVKNVNRTEMTIKLVNGSLIQVMGVREMASLRGANPYGIIFSEYGYVEDPTVFATLLPILRASNGWAIFISTPHGKNNFYDMFKMAQQQPKTWFAYFKTVKDTKHISEKEIEDDIANGVISYDMAQQEYNCSFDMGISGVVYGSALDRMWSNDQIGDIPWMPEHQVHTSWDIGNDTTAICFFQVIGPKVHIIDYYERASENLEHYINMLKLKPYTYGKHYFPHDMAVTEWAGPKFTRVEKARQLGVKATIVDSVGLEDGIEVTRSALARMYIDQVKCKQLIKCLENYRYEWNDKLQRYSNKPLHNYASHGCFVGETLIKTPNGDIRIDKIKEGMEVITPLGIRKVKKVFKHKANDTVTIETNYSSFTATRNHEIFTNTGTVSADALRYIHNLQPYNWIMNILWKKTFTLLGEEYVLKGFKKSILSLRMAFKRSLMGTFIDGMAFIMQERKQKTTHHPTYIEQFTSTMLVKYLMDIIFTIRTKILETMPLKIWKSYMHLLIQNYTPISKILGQNLNDVSSFSDHLMAKQRNGIEAKPALSGIVSTQQIHCLQLNGCDIQSRVQFVRSTILESRHGKNIVQTNVKQKIESFIKKILFGAIASYAKLHSFVIDMLLKRHAIKNVQYNVHEKPVAVYDLMIEKDNCYFANNYLVSNSDSLRYCAISLGKSRDGMSQEDVDKLRREAQYSEQPLPKYFYEGVR